jgi:hypothetical protein
VLARPKSLSELSLAFFPLLHALQSDADPLYPRHGESHKELQEGSMETDREWHKKLWKLVADAYDDAGQVDPDLLLDSALKGSSGARRDMQARARTRQQICAKAKRIKPLPLFAVNGIFVPQSKVPDSHWERIAALIEKQIAAMTARLLQLRRRKG